MTALQLRTRRLVAPLLAALLLALGLSVATASPAHAQDTSAVAVNDKDGSSLFKFAFDVRRVMNGVVDQQNAAVAYATCEDCRTVAVSIQLVLVMSDPDVVTPENYAIAVNEGCTSCETMALAYQVVVGTGGPVRFTSEGNKRLAEIRKALHDLNKNQEDMSLEEIKAAVDALVAEMKDIVATELVPLGGRDDDDEDDEELDDDADDDADDDVDEGDSSDSDEPTVSPVPTESSPVTSPTPAETEEPDDDESPAPSPTSSP